MVIPGRPDRRFTETCTTDVEEAIDREDVVAVAGMEPNAGAEGGCGDEHVDGSGASDLGPVGLDDAEDPAVGAGGSCLTEVDRTQPRPAEFGL